MKRQIEEYERLHPRCEACGAAVSGMPHHIKTRGAGGSDDHKYLLRLCVYCHMYIWDSLGPVTFMRLYPHLQEKVLAARPDLEFHMTSRGPGAFQY